MRGKALVLSMTSAFALFGCENGPTQIYTPSPAGAGSVWNNGGGSNTAVDPATKGFTSTSSGSNVQDLCTGDHLAAVWANMVMQPISPPTTAGGLDISGAAWSGMTIEQAEHGFNNDGTLCDPQKVMNPAFPNYKCDHPGNCQSANDGDQFGDGTQVNQWGDNGELWADYRVSNHKIIFLTLWPGYQGTMNFHSIDNKHQYVLGIQTQITKDGQPFTLDWVGNGGKNFIAPADELYRALMATYAPALPVSPPGVTCFDTGRCIKGSFGDVAYFYIPPIGWALWIDNQNAPQPTPSIPTRLDQNLAKVMAYAYTPPLLKMDSEGPVSNATCETNSAAPGCLLGKASNPCILKMGMTYSDFLSNCVQTTGDTTADQTELNKLLGGLSHDTERFFFDVQGIDIDFTDKSLSPMDIVHDKDMPHAMDVSEEFVTDQSTLGAIANDWDYSQTPAVKDLHGTGAVYKEYARLVRANLLALAGIPDGDVSQCLYPQGYQNDPSFNAQAFQQNLPPYCTGFEGFITPALPRQKCDSKGKNCMPDPTDTTDLGPQNAVALLNGLKLGLKPGHPKALFCWDANGDLQNGYSQCTPPGGGDIFSSSFAQVQAVFGKGKLTNLPTDCQDVRFFFKQYVRAVLKYFQVASQNPVPDLSTIK